MTIRMCLMLLVFFCLLVIFQDSFASHFAIMGVSAHLCFLAVFFFSFFHAPSGDKTPPFLYGFLGGAALDFFSTTPFGTFAFSLGIVAALLARLSVFLRRDNIFSFSVAFLLFFALARFLSWIFIWAGGLLTRGNIGPMIYPGARGFINEVIVNFLFALLIFAILNYLKRVNIFNLKNHAKKRGYVPIQ